MPNTEPAALSTSVAHFVVFSAVASSVWLPLVVVAGRPLDNYITVLITPLALALLVKRKFHRAVTPMILGYGVLVVAAGLAAYLPTSTLASLSEGRPYDAMGPVLRFLSYAWFVALAAWCASKSWRALDVILKVAATVLAISMWATQAGLLELPSYVDRESSGIRIGGLVGHPNFAAYFLSVALLHIVGREDRTLSKYGFVLLFGSALLMTGSRTAVVGLILGILYLAGRAFRRSAGTVIAAVVLVATTGSLLVERFTTFFDSGGISGSNSSGWRLTQWTRALELQEIGGFTGVGWGRAQEFLPGNLGVHNGYLQVWVELGVLGALGLGLIILGLVRLAAAGDHTSTAVVICLLVANMSDPVILYPPVILLATAVLCIGLARANSYPTSPPAHA